MERPDPGARALPRSPARPQICDGTTIFHDCRRSELTVRQIRNTREADIAPFGFRMDVFRFDGSFLSLVIDLPEEAARGLKPKHLIRLDVIVEMEKPLEIFARLNIKHGPNVEQIVRELPLERGRGDGGIRPRLFQDERKAGGTAVGRPDLRRAGDEPDHLARRDLQPPPAGGTCEEASSRWT